MAWASLRVVDGLDSGKLLADAKGQQDWLTTHRRHLHQWPELMFEEYNTSKYIRDRLDELGITYRFGPRGSFLIAQQQVFATLLEIKGTKQCCSSY